jgi:hypothetical protein
MGKYDDVEITRRIEFGTWKSGYVTHEPLLLPGEPFFLLRGKDATAPGEVLHYAQRAREVGRFDLADTATEVANRMIAWQQANEEHVKLPD